MKKLYQSVKESQKWGLWLFLCLKRCINFPENGNYSQNGHEATGGNKACLSLKLFANICLESIHQVFKATFAAALKEAVKSLFVLIEV